MIKSCATSIKLGLRTLVIISSLSYKSQQSIISTFDTGCFVKENKCHNKWIVVIWMHQYVTIWWDFFHFPLLSIFYFKTLKVDDFRRLYILLCRPTLYICSQKRPHDSISLYGICQSALGVCEVESLYDKGVKCIRWNGTPKKGPKHTCKKLLNGIASLWFS